MWVLVRMLLVIKQIDFGERYEINFRNYERPKTLLLCERLQLEDICDGDF